MTAQPLTRENPSAPTRRVSVLLFDWNRLAVLDERPPTDEELAGPIRQIFTGYQPGDTVDTVYEYDVADDGRDPVQVAEQAFRMFNRQPADAWEEQHSRAYYRAAARSLSVGDVVQVGDVALAVRNLGWETVAAPVEAGN